MHIALKYLTNILKCSDTSDTEATEVAALDGLDCSSFPLSLYEAFHLSHSYPKGRMPLWKCSIPSSGVDCDGYFTMNTEAMQMF